MALPIVLLALVVLSVIAVTSIQTAGRAREAGGGSLQSTKAFYAAEAGLHEVIASWDSARYDTMTALAGAGDSLDLGKRLIQENGQVYRAMIYHLGDSTSKQYRITSEEMMSGMGRRVAVTVSAKSVSKYVLFSTGDLKVSNGSVTGSIGANGNIGLNGPIYGDARAGGAVDNPNYVSGVVQQGAPRRSVAAMGCPTGGYGPAPIGASGIVFDPVTGNLDLSDQTTKTFSTGAYYFHDFDSGNQGALEIPAGETVRIYVGGSLRVANDGFLNQNTSAAALTIIGCGTDATDWILGGSGNQSLTVIAPNHYLRLLGSSGVLTGSFIAGAIDKTTSGTVTYSGDTGSPNVISPVPGTWADLSE